MKEHIVNKNIQSRDYKNVYANFEVLVDPKPTRGEPVMALMVDPKRGEKFLMPMDMRAARDLGTTILETVYKVSPELLAELFQ